MKESYTDVLIIGAGPAGLMFANALIHAGASVRIVDKRPEGLVAGQADGCHARTLEIMHSYGLVDQLLQRGCHMWKGAFYTPNTDGTGVMRSNRSPACRVSAARWPHAVTLHQGAIEDIFCESMQTKGLEVERGTFPTSLVLTDNTATLMDSDAYTAEVVLSHLNGTSDDDEIVHAKYVLGSDGAHSWTRKTLGIRAEGDTTGSVWGVVDFIPETDLPDFRAMAYFQSAEGSALLIPREGDLIRLYIQQPPERCAAFLDPHTGRVDTGRTSPEVLLDQVRKIIKPYRITAKDGDISWWTLYSIGQRVAETYSVHNRVFIAGDACHTHAPTAGQGMNASMGDAHNLAWKLAYVLRGWARPALLETYETERRTFAQELIDFDKVYVDVVETGKGGKVSAEELAKVYEKSSRFISGFGIKYSPSQIISADYQSAAPNLIVGERIIPQVFMRVADARPIEIQDLCPSDTRFKILVFGGDVAVEADRAQLQAAADALDSSDGFLHRFGHGTVGNWATFDVLCFSVAQWDAVDHIDFPEFFRPHWTKVFIDGKDLSGRSGGGGYAQYAIDPRVGAIVVVRPDGYVGTVVPLDGVDHLNAYFGSFLV